MNLRNAFFITSLLVCFLLIGSMVRADVDAPELRCVALDSTGNEAKLTWVLPADPQNEFVNYTVYSSNMIAGPYTKVAIVSNKAVDSVTLNGSFSGQIYFFLRTFFNDGSGLDSSSTSDTLRPIIIIATSPSAGVAELVWNPLHLPELSSSLGVYSIYRYWDPEGWSFRGTKNFGDELFNDTVQLCYDTVMYRIEIGDQAGCTSVSNYGDIILLDDLPPEPPELKCVGVDSVTGDVVLNWTHSDTNDVFGYIVIRLINGVEIHLDTLFGSGISSYIDTLANAQSSSEAYLVVAFDSCIRPTELFYNVSPSLQPVRSILLESGDLNVCEGTVLLSWNNIQDIPTGVDHLGSYKLYAKKDSGAAFLVASINKGDTSYTHTGLEVGSTYEYFIAAVDSLNAKEALSNRNTVFVVPPKQPAFHYLSNLIVNSDNSVTVQCYVDTTAAIDHYVLSRAIREKGPYQIVKRVFETDNSMLDIIDEEAKAEQHSYYYKVSAVNVCQDIAAVSNTSRTIWLDGVTDDETFINSLQWNHYSDWDTLGSGVEIYNLYRVLNRGGEVAIVHTAEEDSAYSEDISDLRIIDGNICYFVEASEADGNALGFKARSRSNVLCLQQPPKVFVPNVFTPNGDGLNDVFLPVVNYIDPIDYRLLIRSRLGDVVFETRELNAGWDGTGFASGVYVYHLVMKNARGEAVELSGVVNLIK